jgi:hypothetical protein
MLLITIIIIIIIIITLMCYFLPSETSGAISCTWATILPAI